MRGKTLEDNLVPLNLEIEATCRRNNASRRIREEQERKTNQRERGASSFAWSSTFPVVFEESTVSNLQHIFEEPLMAEDRPPIVTLEDYYSSFSTPQYFTNIARPKVQATNISYPHSFIQLIQGNLVHGLPNKDMYAHLATYREICNTVKITRVPEDAIYLNLFSFSLADEAKGWLHLFKGNSLRTW